MFKAHPSAVDQERFLPEAHEARPSLSRLVARDLHEVVGKKEYGGGMKESKSNCEKRIYRIADLQVMLGGVTRPTIHRWINSGKIPPPTKLGRCTCWLKSDFDVWLAEWFNSTSCATEPAPEPKPKQAKPDWDVTGVRQEKNQEQLWLS